LLTSTNGHSHKTEPINRDIGFSWLYHGPRLAFQPVLMWWALFCAGVIDWPFRARADRM
jgi:hypothetical protein